MPRTVNPAFAGATLLLDGGVRNQIRLAWRLLRDERVTSLKYALPALMALYVASPIDPIPDFLLGVGQMDDLGVLIAGVMLLVRVVPKLAPAHIVEEHLRRMSGALDDAAFQAAEAARVVDADFSVRH
jgi:uncharacterized membrane protein YkvA (DUF1232 family)